MPNGYAGTVKLVDKDGNCIRKRVYQNRKIRQELIDGWRMEIGKPFLKMYIQISPNSTPSTNEEEIIKRRLKKANKNPIPCQRLKLNTFMLTTYDQLLKKSLGLTDAL